MGQSYRHKIYWPPKGWCTKTILVLVLFEAETIQSTGAPNYATSHLSKRIVKPGNEPTKVVELNGGSGTDEDLSIFPYWVKDCLVNDD